MKTTATKRVLGAIGVAGVLAGGMLAQGSPAQAAGRDGVCDSGEFCYYYNSDEAGSVSDFTGSLGDYGTTQPSCYDFKGAGAGKGKCIKNEAASAWNRTSQTVRIYYNSNYGGTYLDIKSGAKANLGALKNQNASHQVGVSTGGGSYTPKDDYPYKGATSGVDPWNFYKGQCTSFAAWAINSRLGIKFSNSYKGQHWGNAINWDNAARAAGISVSGTPKAGDIAVRNSGTYGHVAFVTKVNSNGTVEVDEYNFVHSNAYDHRTAAVGNGTNSFDAFIHFT